ncbi:hypothetical protein VitviT2T_018846 [Vitis vinifera]|uniref:Uncharacterized protein n=1 Tax=Vitis vinifera TaxID=29760 RepID=A0ABY9CYP8_VITVI|nr:hypothetical protein VitviT2T_018846 [Vitis vinifera]
MSRRSSDSQDTVVNSEEINYPKIQNDLDDWKLPKVSNQEIYKKRTFKFFIDYTIKTSEMSVSLEQDDQVIRLLDNRSIDKHKKDGYNFIHFEGQRREREWVCCGFDVSLGEEAEQLEAQLVPLEGSISRRMALEAAAVEAAVTDVYRDGRSLLSWYGRKFGYWKNLKRNNEDLMQKARELWELRNGIREGISQNRIRPDTTAWLR